jgi:hypothetical protein
MKYLNGKYVLLENTVEAQMINFLAKKYSFSYEVIYANQSWGALENGIWVGSVGYLSNKVCIQSVD